MLIHSFFRFFYIPIHPLTHLPIPLIIHSTAYTSCRCAGDGLCMTCGGRFDSNDGELTYPEPGPVLPVMYTSFARCSWSITVTEGMVGKQWWRHQMETFSALLAFCAGNSPVTGEFPSQRPVTQSFDVFFDLCLTKRLSKRSWGWWFETPWR